MSSQSIVCVSCSATVPYGRLSCPTCGELLASVAGAARRVPVERAAPKRAARASRIAPVPAAVAAGAAVPASAAAKATVASTAAVDPTPAAAAPAVPAFGAPSKTPAYAPRPPRRMPSVLVDVAPPADPLTVEPRLTDAAGWDAEDVATPEPPATHESGWEAARVDDEPQWPTERPATPFAVAAKGIEEHLEASVSLPYVLQPVSPQTAAIGAPPMASPAVAAPTKPAAPGAYVPPIVTTDPAGPPAPARAWAGHSADESEPDAAARASAAAGAVMDSARLPEFIGWLAVAGSAMAAVGFVLPWGITVIGATGVDYFDRWGMAGPFHPIVVLALLGTLGLALVRNGIPLWVRVGLPGLGLGALLIGLGWPYLVALPGRGPGVLVVAIGAILLIVAGILALVTDRHAAEDRAV